MWLSQKGRWNAVLNCQTINAHVHTMVDFTASTSTQVAALPGRHVAEMGTATRYTL